MALHGRSLPDEGSQAVVVGSGPAGLLAAFALRKRFERVCMVHAGADLLDGTTSSPALIDAGETPEDEAALLLLSPGCAALEQLSPGAVDDLLEAGAVSFEAGAGFRWRSQGQQVGGSPSGLETVSASRRLVRSVLARRLSALGGVRWISRAEVVDLDLAERTQKTRGVFYRRLDGADETEWLRANVVVDATGRSASSERWLQRLGFGNASTRRWGLDRLALRTSCRWPGGFGEPRYTWLIEEGSVSASLQPVEDGRWVAMISRPAHLSSAVSPTVAGLTDFIQSLGPLRKTPLQEARWRSPLRPGPGGFLSLGNAQISFDPVFDMGLTTAARSAHLLSAHLGEDPSLIRLRRWQRRQKPTLRRAWRVQRWRHRMAGESGADLGNVLARARANRRASRRAEARFLRMLNLADSPLRLVMPLL